MHPGQALWNLASAVIVPSLTRVFMINGHSYKVCCDCGTTFRYSLETMLISTGGD
jgi:uncharacterized membrane protein